MPLYDQIRDLVAAGATEKQIKEALAQVTDDRELVEHAAGFPAIPTLGPVLWAGLKARLTDRSGPGNKFRALQLIHEGLETDDQPKFWGGLFGLVKAVWREHPGYRRGA